jgi:signal transduction histidine kinase
MKLPLQILYLEDDELDADLAQAMLRSEGLVCEVTWVQSQAEFQAALEQVRFDVILSDYTVPGFDGLAALELVRQRAPECPVIFVTGTLGEEAAIDALKRGATDYVLKDRPARLAASIQHALQTVAAQAERKRAEEELKRSREEMRALAARLLSSREEERLCIAREIHDEFGEVLTGLKLGLTWVRTRLEARDQTIPWAEVFAKMDALKSMADQTANQVRRFCAELRPAVLDDLGLAAAIEWQAREFKARTGIRCELKMPAATPAIDRTHATALFRIFQEILTNVARHAHASKVSVELRESATKVLLKVDDNGKGISAGAAGDSRSLGILGMRERARLLGGEFAIRGAPRRGTTVTVCVPMNVSNPKLAATV